MNSFSSTFPSSFGVYLVTDGGKLRTEGKLTEILVKLVSGFSSIVGVQIRERLPDSKYPPASTEYVSDLCHALKKNSSREDFIVTINSEIELCRDSGADGVHLGYRSMVPEEARRILGSGYLVGYSAHSIEEVLASEPEVVDYLYLSPIFQPASKAYSGNILGVKALENLRASSIPVFALGGIKAENIEEVYETGAAGVSVISSILYAENPLQAMSEFDNKIFVL